MLEATLRPRPRLTVTYAGDGDDVPGLARHYIDGFISDHPDFEARVLDAEQDALEHVEEALYQAAISGNVTACGMWLDRHERRQRTPTPGGTSPSPAQDRDEIEAALEESAGAF